MNIRSERSCTKGQKDHEHKVSEVMNIRPEKLVINIRSERS
jgi:hypothetical protein